MVVRKIIIAKYKNNKINSEVKRASHTHQVPHMGFPQSEPVTRAMTVNEAPIGAVARAATWASAWRQMRAAALAAAIAV